MGIPRRKFIFNDMMQKEFAERVVTIVKQDPGVTGLAVAGSWLDNELDDYSDLDLILVTKEKIGGVKDRMLVIAKGFGDLISGFTGEHVGEPRLLICLYDNPLLHVDIKFLTLPELRERVEDPEVLFERDNALSGIIKNSKPNWPEPDLQWIEDRFWTWVHYACLKIGRGELMEAYDFLSYLRQTVLSPLMQLKNKKKIRGVRRVETELSPADLENLKITIAQYNKASVVRALENAVGIYRSLRRKIYPASVTLQERAEKRSLEYLKKIKQPG